MSRDLRRQASRHSIEREMAGVHQGEVWRNAQKNLSQTPSSLFLPPLEKQVPRFPTFMPQYGQTLVPRCVTLPYGRSCICDCTEPKVNTNHVLKDRGWRGNTVIHSSGCRWTSPATFVQHPLPIFVQDAFAVPSPMHPEPYRRSAHANHEHASHVSAISVRIWKSMGCSTEGGKDARGSQCLSPSWKPCRTRARTHHCLPIIGGGSGIIGRQDKVRERNWLRAAPTGCHTLKRASVQVCKRSPLPTLRRCSMSGRILCED